LPFLIRLGAPSEPPPPWLFALETSTRGGGQAIGHTNPTNTTRTVHAGRFHRHRLFDIFELSSLLYQEAKQRCIGPEDNPPRHPALRWRFTPLSPQLLWRVWPAHSVHHITGFHPYSADCRTSVIVPTKRRRSTFCGAEQSIRVHFAAHTDTYPLLQPHYDIVEGLSRECLPNRATNVCSPCGPQHQFN